MKKAAQADGINIQMVSSFRSFTKQQAIFERKYERYTEEGGMEPLAAM